MNSAVINAMSAMMEHVGTFSVHHVSTTPPKDKKILADQVLQQMRQDFFVASPFTLHASVPEALAAAWVLIRETLMCGEAPRGLKEIVASGVSKANQCPFCVGAHVAAVVASQTSDERLREWAEATGQANHPALISQPFDKYHAEYLGTVVGFSYLNRMVSVFLDDKLMPIPNALDGTANFMARIMMGGMIRKGSQNQPGQALHLLPEVPREDAWRPTWAVDSPTIADALSGWSAVNEYLAKEYLPPEVITNVEPIIEKWDGSESYVDINWLSKNPPIVTESHRAAVELALLTVVAPYRITDTTVKDVLKSEWTKEQVLVLVAWAAQRAARRVGDWTAAAGINIS